MNELTIISKKIITLPGRPLFMLDRDVAELYETETKYVNRAARRNPERFPEDFFFELTGEEFQKVVADCDHLSRTGAKLAPVTQGQPVTDCDRFSSLKHSTVLPFAFTREGCNMLSAVLSTPVAIQRSIQIMRAFSAMERDRFGAADAAPSGLLPNGWQMYELRMIYGPEGAKKIMGDLYGVGVDRYRTEVSPLERNIISFENPSTLERNHMIWELARKRGISQTKLAELSGFSRNTISEICKKIDHLRTKALR